MNRFRMAALCGMVAAGAAACGDDIAAPADARVYELEVAGELFRVAITDSATAARAEQLLASGAANNVNGALRRGHGGFNAPYSWHMDPATIEFPDMTIEVCDGRPQSDVEQDVRYWVDTVGRYCPWGATVVRRIR